jgi:hypothetical protein
MRCVHARARLCLCVSMQQFVGLLDLNTEAAYSWLMSLTFFLSTRQNNALDVYATLLSVAVISVFRQICASACFLNYPVIYKWNHSHPTYSSWTRKSMLYRTSCDHSSLCCCYFSLPLVRITNVLFFSISSCFKELMSIGVPLRMTNFGSVWELSSAGRVRGTDK